MTIIQELSKSHISINKNLYKLHIKDIENYWKIILQDNNIRNIKPNIKLNIIKSLSSIKHIEEGIVMKFGSWDNNIINNDYLFGKELENINGFIKYICYLECEDNIINLLNEHKLYSDLTNSDSSIIISSYYKYNINNYNWEYNYLYDLQNCLKQIFLSYYSAYYNLKIVFNNSNINNILLNFLKNKKDIIYSISEYDDIKLNNCSIEIVINDFENCEKIDDIHNKYYYNVLYCTLISIFDQFDNIDSIKNIKNYLLELLNTLPEPYKTIKNIFDIIDNIYI